MGGISSYAFSAIFQNEVGGNPAIADRLTPPSSAGRGWTIGFNQEDFLTNPEQASATLVGALTASNQFSSDNAQAIADALAAAGPSASPDLSGIVDNNGNPATIASINAALQSSAGQNSILTSGQNDFANSFAALTTSVFQSSSLNPAVAAALADPTHGPALQIALADYNNQYSVNIGGAMWQLLTTGNATFGGNNSVSLDTTNAATVTQSVMSAILNTTWVGSGNGAQACDRLATDLSQATAYDESQGITPPSGATTLTSSFGQL